MKKTILSVFVVLLFAAISFAQNDIYVTAGRTKLLELKAPGNYTSYTLLFVAKNSNNERVIQKTLSKSYATPYTTMVCTLNVSDTQDLTTNASYPYDIVAYGVDTVTVKQGKLNILSPVQTAFDGTNLPSDGTRVTTVSLDNGTKQDEMVTWDAINHRWSPTGRVLPQAQKDSIGAMISDSVHNATWKYIDKTSTQTITGQKNFIGTVKFGSDTTMRLGFVEDQIRTGLYIQALPHPTHPYGMNRIFKSVPSDVNSGAWSLVTSTVDWRPTRPGQDIPINLGYNWDGEITAGWGAGQWGFQLEPNYEWQDTLTVYEYFLYYNNYPYPNTTYGVRPFQVGIFRGLSGYYHKRTVAIDVDELTIGKSGGTSIVNAFRFNLGKQMSPLGKNDLRLNDTTTIYQTVNNIGWLFQSSSVGSATELMRLDNTNSVVLAPNGNDIKLSGQIFGSATNSAPSFGKWTTQKNYGIAFRTTGTYSGGSIHWNGDNAYFALTQGGGQISGNPDDWENIHPDNYKTSLFLGGVVLIGNKNYGNLDRGIRIGYSSTTPTGVSGTTSLYTVGYFSNAELNVMNASGVVSQLSGDPIVGTVLPRTDNTYYIGKNSTSSPAAWKGIILKDQVNGNYYRIEMINGVLTTTQL